MPLSLIVAIARNVRISAVGGHVLCDTRIGCQTLAGSNMLTPGILIEAIQITYCFSQIFVTNSFGFPFENLGMPNSQTECGEIFWGLMENFFKMMKWQKNWSRCKNLNNLHRNPETPTERKLK